MTAEEIISSGALELYVCGALPKEEIQDIENAIATYPTVKKELEHIEATLMRLSEKTAPTPSAMVWSTILTSIRTTKNLSKKYRWASLSGWAAAFVCICGIAWLLQQNYGLTNSIVATETEKEALQNQLIETSNELQEATNILTILRSKEYNAITLPGNQAVSPNAFTKVYFSKKEQIVYIDTQGLPKAPDGKVYQVWSLQMDPLTPTSVGLVTTVNRTASNLYKFNAVETSPQAFGITLEPAGGSESPTLTQLYTLGMVSP